MLIHDQEFKPKTIMISGLFPSVPMCPFPSLAFPGLLRLSPAVPGCLQLSWLSHVCPRLSPNVPGCPWQSPTVPVCPRLSLAVPGCPWQSPTVPVFPPLSPSVPGGSRLSLAVPGKIQVSDTLCLCLKGAKLASCELPDPTCLLLPSCLPRLAQY